jgi:molybdenum cofactor sulfurtransferase
VSREALLANIHGDTTYLDHAGTTLASKSLIDAFSQQMQAHLLANPHSASMSAPNTSHQIVESTRSKVLSFLGASPEHFDVVFVANATAGIKLVLEAFLGHEKGFDYIYHRDSHTSLVGIRELANQSRCICSDEEVEGWLRNGNVSNKRSGRPTLFAYPGQSNMNGRRLPLRWAGAVRSSSRHVNTYTLLDIAALATTTPVQLNDPAVAPDFVVMSFYKIFGFPDLGALIIRKDAAHIFDKRKYFGGGTTEMITCAQKPWVARKESGVVARLEDGTGPTHSILALRCAIDAHKKLFGGMKDVSTHTGWLAKRAHDQLRELKHANGLEICRIYKDPSSTYGDAQTQGATISFNVCRSDGTWIGSSRVGRMAAERDIHIRTGSLCNPAGMAHALGLSDDDVQQAFYSGFRCGQENDVRNDLPFGMVRISFGAVSTMGDVDVFLRFMEECFVEDSATSVVAEEEDIVKKVESDALRCSEQSSIGLDEKSALHGGKKRWRLRLSKLCLPSRDK